MKKKLFVSFVILVVMIISATIALSNPGWRRAQIQSWDKDKLVTIEGKIKDIYGQLAIIESGNTEYLTRLGPYWYWQEKGYKVEKDKYIKVTGMVVEIDGKQNVFPQKVVIDDKEIILSDENGIPVWAGQRGHHGRGRQAGFYGYKGGSKSPYCWRWRNSQDSVK